MLFQQVRATREAVLGTNPPDVAETLNDLAELYVIQRKYVQSELLLKLALAILEATLGKDHPAVAQTINTLSLLSRKQQNQGPRLMR